MQKCELYDKRVQKSGSAQTHQHQKLQYKVVRASKASVDEEIRKKRNSVQQVNEMKKNHFIRRTFAIYNDLNAYNHVK